MIYKVKYSKRFDKAFSKLDRPIQKMIFGWIEKNLIKCTDPRFSGKALQGNKKLYWRYRVGQYRLIAKIDDDVIEIELIEVGHRKEIYK